MLLFLTTNMVAVTSRANKQLIIILCTDSWLFSKKNTPCNFEIILLEQAKFEGNIVKVVFWGASIKAGIVLVFKTISRLL